MITISAPELRDLRKRRREERKSAEEWERKVISDLLESADESPAGEKTGPMPNDTDRR